MKPERTDNIDKSNKFQCPGLVNGINYIHLLTSQNEIIYSNDCTQLKILIITCHHLLKSFSIKSNCIYLLVTDKYITNCVVK